MSVIAETPEIVIRNFYADEEIAFLDLFSDKQVAEHLPHRNREENRKIFLDTLKEDAEGAIFSRWAIIDKTGKEFAGMCLLRQYNDEPDKLEIGYCLHVKYWGQGIATQVVGLLTDYAAKHPGITNIVAVTTLGNIASQVVLQRCGLIKQGTIVRNNEELIFFKMQL